MDRQRILSVCWGGLANRIQNVESCLSLSLATSRALKVHWPLDWALGALFESLFQIPEGAEVLSTADFVELDRETREFDANFELDGNYFSDREYITEKELEAVLAPFDRVKISAWQRLHCGMQRRRRLALNRQIQSMLSTYSHLAKGRIGIHVRRTDHSGAISLSPDESFFVFLDDQQGDFFLCTDDEEVEYSFRKRYGDRIISYEKRSRERDAEIGIQDALIDLCLLAECRFIVGSSASTFSSCASFWGGNPLHRVLRYA